MPFVLPALQSFNVNKVSFRGTGLETVTALVFQFVFRSSIIPFAQANFIVFGVRN